MVQRVTADLPTHSREFISLVPRDAVALRLVRTDQALGLHFQEILAKRRQTLEFSKQRQILLSHPLNERLRFRPHGMRRSSDGS